MQDANALHLPFEGLARTLEASEAMCRMNLIRTADNVWIHATMLLSTAPRASAQTKTAAPDRVIPNPKRGGNSARLGYPPLAGGPLLAAALLRPIMRH